MSLPLCAASHIWEFRVSLSLPCSESQTCGLTSPCPTPILQVHWPGGAASDEQRGQHHRQVRRQRRPPRSPPRQPAVGAGCHQARRPRQQRVQQRPVAPLQVPDLPPADVPASSPAHQRPPRLHQVREVCGRMHVVGRAAAPRDPSRQLPAAVTRLRPCPPHPPRIHRSGLAARPQ
jgi:hypothetical protein